MMVTLGAWCTAFTTSAPMRPRAPATTTAMGLGAAAVLVIGEGEEGCQCC